MKFIPSMAVMALIANVSAIQIHSQIGTGADLSSNVAVDSSLEANRFYGANGKPIILAETEGHARIELTKVNKYTHEYKQT